MLRTDAESTPSKEKAESNDTLSRLMNEFAALRKEAEDLRKENLKLNKKINTLYDLTTNNYGKNTETCIRENNVKRLKKILVHGSDFLDYYRMPAFRGMTVTHYSHAPCKNWFTFAAKLQHWECVAALAEHTIRRYNRVISMPTHDHFYILSIDRLIRDAAEALHLAARANVTTTITTLLEINLITTSIRHPILHWAIYHNDITIFQLMLEKIYRDSINDRELKKTITRLKDGEELSALEYAISLGNRDEFIQKLKKYYDEESLHKQLNPSHKEKNLLGMFYSLFQGSQDNTAEPLLTETPAKKKLAKVEHPPAAVSYDIPEERGRGGVIPH